MASAAAIYGSKATNGVVIITTKRGQLGKPQFSLSQKFGVLLPGQRAGLAGPSPLWTRRCRSSVDTARVTAAFQPGGSFNFEDELYGREALSYETNASVSGGTENTQYYVSGLVKNDEGIALNTGYKKQSLRSNLDQELGSGVQLQVNLERHPQLVGSRPVQQRQFGHQPLRGLSGHAELRRPSAGRRHQDEPAAVDFPTNPFERSNPLQTFNFLTNEEDVWRLLGTTTLRWSALRSAKSNLQFIGIGGVDYFQQDNNLVSPPELQYEPNDGQPGTVVLSKSSNRNLNAALNVSWRLQSVRHREGQPVYHVWRGSVRGAPALRHPDSGAHAAAGAEEPTADDQPDRLVTGRAGPGPRHLRAGGSAAGQPAAAAHRGRASRPQQLQRRHRTSSSSIPRWRPPTGSSRPFGGVDELKLRGAYGQTGNRRVCSDAKFSPTPPAPSADSSAPTSATGPAIRTSSRSDRRSSRAGFDATLANGRAELTLTAYQRNISDLILEQTIAPSVGQETRIFSSGSRMRNRGIEASLTLQPVQRRDVNWIFRTTFFANRAMITELNVPSFQTGGFALSLGTFQIEEDSSPTQIFGTVGTDARGANRRQGGRRQSRLPDVVLQRHRLQAISPWASCSTGSTAATSST